MGILQGNALHQTIYPQNQVLSAQIPQYYGPFIPAYEVLMDPRGYMTLYGQKRTYVPVDLAKRSKLVQLIQFEGCTIKEASILVGINYSTAKHIYRTYKKTGQLET